MSNKKRFTKKMRDRFISVLAARGNVGMACEAINRSYYWAYCKRKQKPRFARRWEEAIRLAHDRLEDEAWRRAKDGVLKKVSIGGGGYLIERQYSDSLLHTLLKANKPKKFERFQKLMMGDNEATEDTADPTAIDKKEGVTSEEAMKIYIAMVTQTR